MNVCYGKWNLISVQLRIRLLLYIVYTIFCCMLYYFVSVKMLLLRGFCEKIFILKGRTICLTGISVCAKHFDQVTNVNRQVSVQVTEKKRHDIENCTSVHIERSSSTDFLRFGFVFILSVYYNFFEPSSFGITILKCPYTRHNTTQSHTLIQIYILWHADVENVQWMRLCCSHLHMR